MSALHLTSHIGTRKNIENVFKFLNIENKLVTQKCINTSYYYNENTSNELWNYYSDKLDGINVLIFTDTSMIARPFLQNIEKQLLILSNHLQKVEIHLTKKHLPIDGFIGQAMVSLIKNYEK